jgi:hypothetical protein
VQGSFEDPGNPWPHDMLLTIDDSPNALQELLWVREAWQLNPEGSDLPPLLKHGPVPVGLGPAEWSRGWADLWHASVAHSAQVTDPSVFERLPQTADGSAERASLLNLLVGPSWRGRFGDDAFTDAYGEWMHDQNEALRLRRPLAYDDTPERRCLEPLIAAWRSGITAFVLIPCQGTHTRRIGAAALLLTEETRNDPDRYAAALRAAAEGGAATAEGTVTR